MRPYAKEQVWPHVLSAAREHALKPGDAFKECAQDCPEMVVVPSGSFTMGGFNNAQPRHLVTFARAFAVSKYELIFAEWNACVAAGGCNGYKPQESGWGGKEPINEVNWDDAQAYVAWFSRMTGKLYRLLSEAEYEYVMRAGTTTAYPWGDDIKLDGTAMAACDGCGSEWDNKRPALAGSFPPNKFGLYDMTGNVWEWTEDCSHNSYVGAPKDGSAWGGDCSRRILRGGSWYDPPSVLRSWYRKSDFPSVRNDGIGFRVARTLSAGTGATTTAPSVR
jgi:formylglycine-generating enzyme required for sulfatase activity